MIRTLVSHSVKRFFRSSSATKDIAVGVAVVVIVFFVVSYALALGFFLEEIIVTKLNQADPVGFLNQLMIYYFVSEFLLRYFLQNLPAWDIQPYLHLPIKRSSIVNFLLGRSLFHFLNSFIFLLFTPIALGVVTKTYGTGPAMIWLLSLWLVSLVNHYLVIVLKQKVAHDALGMLIFMSSCVLVATLDYLNIVRLSSISAVIFNDFLLGYRNTCIVLAILVVLYFIAHKQLMTKMYPDELHVPEVQTFRSADLGILKKMGLVGAWINIELKLIFRNKRSREVFLLHIVFFLATFIIWYQKQHSQIGFYFLLGVFSSGCFTANYGQYLYGWQAHHFDFTTTQPTSIRFFVESKYWLLTFITVLWLLCSIPFVYFGWHFLLITVVCAVYNIGVSTFIIMNMSMWGAKKIDLTHKGSLNYEGAGAAQWVMSVPFMAAPAVLFFPLSLAGYPIMALVFVGLVGLTGIIFHKTLLDFTTRRLIRLRYTLAANFKKES